MLNFAIITAPDDAVLLLAPVMEGIHEAAIGAPADPLDHVFHGHEAAPAHIIAHPVVIVAVAVSGLS